MIAIGGDCCSHPAPQDFPIVEGIVAGIRPRNEETAQRVTGAVHKSSFPQLIIARIEAPNCGNNGIDHIILNRAVGESGSVALEISFRALGVSGFAVLRLAYWR